jgi:hypothetical protein
MKHIFFVLSIGLLLGTFSIEGWAQSKSREKVKSTTVKKTAVAKAVSDSIPKKDSTAKPKGYDAIVKESTQQALGFVNIYSKGSKYYFDFPVEMMEREMLLASTISEISDNMEGLVGSKPQNPLLIRWMHVDSSVLLTKVENDFADSPDANVNNAIKKNTLGAVLKIFPVVAYNKNKSRILIDVSDFFLSDNKELSPFGAFSMYRSSGYKITESFKKDRSYIGQFKSFENNLLVKSHLTFENTISQGTRVLVKDRPVSVVLTRSLLLLPESPEQPRKADSRIGIFTTRKTVFSTTENRTNTVHYANRFQLKPKNEADYLSGKGSEPIKPIVFYIDNDFPESWKPVIHQAVQTWNLAFEKIGFKNAVQTKDFPLSDSSFDPDNLLYNCIRYAPASIPNAIGPSWVDPRSGEIINASVYVFHDVVKLLNNWIFVQTAPANPTVRKKNIPHQDLMNGLNYVVRHEVGHCLGFMHNMSASFGIPVDSLRSASFTQKYGTTHSIMDYARFNYVAQPGDLEKGVSLAPPILGAYDYYLVDWNYTYFDTKKSIAEQEKILANKIAVKAGDPVYKYGSQMLGGLDPSAQTEDLGDNAVKASTYGLMNLKYILKNLHQWLGKDDYDYTQRTQIWNSVFQQYVNYINHVFTNVGGFYIHEKYEGDSVRAYASVSRQTQLESLEWLIAQLNEMDWFEEQQLIEQLPLMGTPAQVLQGQLMNALMAAPLKVNLNALRSTEANPFTAEESMTLLFDRIWVPSKNKKSLSKADKEWQKLYVQSLMTNAKLIPNSDGRALTNQFQVEGSEFTTLGKTGNVSPFAGIVLDAQEHLLCQHHHALNEQAAYGAMEPIMGFGGFTINFNLAPSLQAQYYAQLKKSAELLKRFAKKGAAADRSHYNYLLGLVKNQL